LGKPRIPRGRPDRRAGTAMVRRAVAGFKFGALMGFELARTIATDGDPAAPTRWAAGLEGVTPT